MLQHFSWILNASVNPGIPPSSRSHPHLETPGNLAVSLYSLYRPHFLPFKHQVLIQKTNKQKKNFTKGKKSNLIPLIPFKQVIALHHSNLCNKPLLHFPETVQYPMNKCFFEISFLTCSLSQGVTKAPRP